MKTAMIALAVTLMAGCAIAPLAPYDAYSPHCPFSCSPSTDNEYYSYGYSRSGCSGYYGFPDASWYGYCSKCLGMGAMRQGRVI